MALVLGYHGCSLATAHSLLGGLPFAPSYKSYDWLGSGSYFWEWDILRAYEWAAERREQPCVVGAVIELGHCLDLTTRAGVKAVKRAYEAYTRLQIEVGRQIPRNEPFRRTNPNDLVLRYLDRAVIEHLHAGYRSAVSRAGSSVREFDTVRALFPEGDKIYPEAGFLEKTHVQIAVCNPSQIRGVFRVPRRELEELKLPDICGGAIV